VGEGQGEGLLLNSFFALFSSLAGENKSEGVVNFFTPTSILPHQWEEVFPEIFLLLILLSPAGENKSEGCC
jgi:hypothetical protein